jgi:hypothetical protein
VAGLSQIHRQRQAWTESGLQRSLRPQSQPPEFSQVWTNEVFRRLASVLLTFEGTAVLVMAVMCLQSLLATSITACHPTFMGCLHVLDRSIWMLLEVESEHWLQSDLLQSEELINGKACLVYVRRCSWIFITSMIESLILFQDLALSCAFARLTFGFVTVFKWIVYEELLDLK